jgi:hypothetical protein
MALFVFQLGEAAPYLPLLLHYPHPSDKVYT